MSKKIGLFYGTQTGNTESDAEKIRDEFGGEVVILHPIYETDATIFDQYKLLIIGSPTWDIGQLQSDWESFFPDLDEIDFSGKLVAYFGDGDQYGYADNFQDAMGILEEKISQRGGKTVGYWPTEGYDFEQSRALKNGKFVGLALDSGGQSDLTDERIKAWVAQLKTEFRL